MVFYIYLLRRSAVKLFTPLIVHTIHSIVSCVSICITYPMPSAFVSLVFGDQQPGAGPTFKYDAGPVRRRADRQKLPGWSCAVCKEVGVGGGCCLGVRKLGVGCGL